ncbi:MAG: hypothetical protein IH859_00720 [Chloroflexi bacterium]|nr:hypothetical protein [Chloroflexota bacterium]
MNRSARRIEEYQTYCRQPEDGSDNSSSVKAAKARADQVLDQARLDADIIRREADDYTMESLTMLEIELERLNNQVRNGIRALQDQATVKQRVQQPMEEHSGN